MTEIKKEKKDKRTAAQKYHDNDARTHFGLFGDLDKPIDLGAFYPWEDKVHKETWKYFNGLAVKNISGSV